MIRNLPAAGLYFYTFEQMKARIRGGRSALPASRQHQQSLEFRQPPRRDQPPRLKSSDTISHARGIPQAQLARSAGLDKPSSQHLFIAGGTAGFMYWACFYPLDVIKSGMQARTGFVSLSSAASQRRRWKSQQISAWLLAVCLGRSRR